MGVHCDEVWFHGFFFFRKRCFLKLRFVNQILEERRLLFGTIFSHFKTKQNFDSVEINSSVLCFFHRLHFENRTQTVKIMILSWSQVHSPNVIRRIVTVEDFVFRKMTAMQHACTR
jgi:hypothetical protein